MPIPANAGAFEAAATYALTAFGVPAGHRGCVRVDLSFYVLLIPGVTAGAIFFSARERPFWLARGAVDSRTSRNPKE